MAKKKILLLSDDLRMASGIATMSKELVLGTVDKYDWFQVGAAINHPDQGKILDLSQDVQQRTGVSDASVKLLARKNQMLSYTLLTLVIGHGCMILSTKSDKTFQSFFTQFGMICQTHFIIEIIMKVAIGLDVFPDKPMVSLKDYQH